MAISRGKASKALAPGLAAIYFARIDSVKKEHTSIVNIKTSKRAWEEEWKWAGLGGFTKKNEGGVYTFDEPLFGDTIRFTHQTYGLAVRVFFEFIEDELYGLMNRISGELGRSAALNKEQRVAGIYNNAFDPNFKGLDGKQLCAVDHPNLGGGTQSNRPAVDADLDLLPLQAAIESFDKWTDDRGVPDPRVPVKLLVTPSFWIKANELLKTLYKPDTNENTLNVVATEYNITPENNHYLSDSDAWFLLADKDMHDVHMYLRKDDSFNNADDPLTDDAIFTGRHRMSEGFGDWRGVYGSSGA